MKKSVLLLFVLASAGELASQFLVEGRWLHQLCKPVIMMALGAFYWLSVNRDNRSWSVLLAVLFSFLGDSFLMYQEKNELYFMLGLGSFLLAHVFYISAYRQHKWSDVKNELQGIQKIRFSFPVILAGTGLVIILYPTLGDLKFPVMVYALVLVLMVLNSIFRYGRTSTVSFWMVLLGALLFMVSDSLIAINKFFNPIKQEGLWVMITYIAAQYLIIAGLLRHPQPAR